MKLLRAFTAVWNGILDEVLHITETVTFVYCVAWERLTDILGAYAIPMFYLGVVLLILMVVYGR